MILDSINIDGTYNSYLEEQFLVHIGIIKRTDRGANKLNSFLKKMLEYYLVHQFGTGITVDSISFGISELNDGKYNPLYIKKLRVVFNEGKYILVKTDKTQSVTSVGSIEQKHIDIVSSIVSVIQNRLDKLYVAFSSEKKRLGQFYIDSMIAREIIAYYDEFMYSEAFTESSESRWNAVFSALLEDYISDILEEYGYRNTTTHVQLLMPLYWAERDSNEYGMTPNIDFIEFSQDEKKYRFVLWAENRSGMFNDVWPIISSLIREFNEMVTRYMKDGKF